MPEINPFIKRKGYSLIIFVVTGTEPGVWQAGTVPTLLHITPETRLLAHSFGGLLRTDVVCGEVAHLSRQEPWGKHTIHFLLRR